MLLRNYVDPQLLGEEIDAGYITRREHPRDRDLWIFNYTKKAQIEGRWNDATRRCRGLITRAGYEVKVIARPFEKFMNLGEHPEGAFNLDAPVWAVDKADGSLGVMYFGPDGWAIATRGSFTSEQAIEGTKMLRERIAEGFQPHPGVTYLFEIVYPENRIVLDYGAKRELVLLAALKTDSVDREPACEAFMHACDWFERAEGHRSTLRKLLTDPPRENSEGYVAYTTDGRMVKVKQQDYIERHRIVFGLSELSVWEALRDGRLIELQEGVPEEFRDWIIAVAQRIQKAANRLHNTASWYAMGAQQGEFKSRAALAAWVKTNSLEPNLTFDLIDGKDIWPSIWRRVRPQGAPKPSLNTLENAA